VGATSGDVRGQLRALRDLGAFPPDVDLDAVFHDLGLDRPPIDPTQLTPDELLHELRELTKQLMAYGARIPKVLMLLVKNLMFLDNAIGSLAPDLDILGEIESVHREIAIRHGERLAAEMGIEANLATYDSDSMKAALGLDASVERLNYRDVQERRATIRRNLQSKQPRLRRPRREH
jgi:ubiquinone biosynthesis protein